MKSHPWKWSLAQGALLALALCGGAARADNITWVGTDFPPMAMSQGAYAHQGYIDAMYRYVQESSPQHVFHEEIVPWSRAMGVASHRSYGPKIDALIQPLISSGARNVQQTYQDESTRYLLTMLASKRFDYTLAYPSEVGFYETSSSEFRFYPMEGNNDLLPGRFSCTKSPQTDRVFADLASLVPTKKSRAVFMAAYERWLPQYLIKPYRQRLSDMSAASP